MKDAAAAAEYIRRRDRRTPDVGVILGSGLGGLVESARDTTVILTGELPGYPRSTVKGHNGRLVIGRMLDRTAVFVQGRLHLYEGYSVEQVTLPVRVLRALGVDRLLITNAAGGINPNFEPASLMFIEDHITLGKLEINAVRRKNFTRRSRYEVYDSVWRARARQAALDLQLRIESGVYAWTQGPNYETPAEVTAFALAGADAVGMSTVPEAVQARLLQMKVLGVSLITNRAAGLQKRRLAHDEVLDRAARMHSSMTHLVRRIIGL